MLAWKFSFQVFIHPEIRVKPTCKPNLRKTVKLTESELIVLAKENPKAFAPLYEKYYLMIFNFVFKRIQREAATADVVSTVFLKALLNLSKYEDRGYPLSSWLYRIAINECNQYFRTQAKNIEINIDTQQLAALAQKMGREGDNNKIKIVIEAMNMLTFEQSTLIELRFFEGRRFKEIGEILGCTEDNAKVKVYRVIKKLKKIIANGKISTKG